MFLRSSSRSFWSISWLTPSASEPCLTSFFQNGSGSFASALVLPVFSCPELAFVFFGPPCVWVEAMTGYARRYSGANDCPSPSAVAKTHADEPNPHPVSGMATAATPLPSSILRMTPETAVLPQHESYTFHGTRHPSQP